MTKKFETAFKYTLKNEGGFSNVTHDRGGATRFGITMSTASRWFKRPVSVKEMENFPLETAKEIYHAWYWLPLNLDAIDSPSVATCIYDVGVVSGVRTSAKLAQKACNAPLVIDGHFGPKTIATINSLDEQGFILSFEKVVTERFYAIVERTPSQKKFLRGWLRRAQRMHTLRPLNLSALY